MFSVRFIYLLILSICAFTGSYAQANENDTDHETSTASTVTLGTIAPQKNLTCEIHNNDCKACVANSQCYFCDTTNKCNFHVEKSIVDGECQMKHVNFLTCRVNFQILLIIIGVAIGLVLLIIIVTCCYCCCKKKGIKLSKDDLKWARQKEERQQIAMERRKERAERTEEIRKKYGLVKDSNPYQRFDA